MIAYKQFYGGKHMAEYDPKNIILDFLQAYSAGVSLFRLKNSIQFENFSSNDIDEALSDLLSNGSVKLTPEGISLVPLTLNTVIENIQPRDTRKLIQSFFNGMKAECKSVSETREIIKSFLKTCPILKEDNYKDLFKKYKFDINSFTIIFDEKQSTYLYLNHKYKKGKQDWRDIRFDETVGLIIIENATQLIASEGLKINNKIVPFSITDVSLHLLSHDKTIQNFQELYQEYCNFIDYQKTLPTGLKTSFSAFKTLLLKSEKIVVGKKQTIRYRETSKIYDNRLLNKLKLHNYKNSTLSASIIFDKYVELMNSCNIIDEYELYHLILKYSDRYTKLGIKFLTPPLLSFGDSNTINQLFNLLSQLSPVTGKDLTHAYEQKYGLKASKVRLTLLPSISTYLRNGYYDLKTKPITDKQLFKASKQLSKPWYFVSEVEVLFKKQVSKQYKEYMSNDNLKRLGYKKTNTIIYSNQYSSLFDCLNQTDWCNSTFIVSDELWVIPQLQIYLNKEMANLNLIEFSPQKFIRLSSLKRSGVHKKDLNALIKLVVNSIEDESYFTLKSLRQSGFILPHDELGFEDTFYYSILKQSNKIQTRRVANTFLFRKSKKEATILDFIEYLLVNLKSIDIYEFCDYLDDKYGILYNPQYIRMIISDSQLFYDTISEKIFIDYEAYFEGV